jgi:hypothetical protein
MRRSKATAAALSIALVLVAGVASTAMAGSPSAAASAKAEHDRIVSYWTAARVASAIPRDFERTSLGTFVPKARPGGGGGSGAVTGASWTNGTTIVQRTGKVLFTMGSSNYVCSGSTVTDSRSGFSLVLTAGHCAYDEAARKFATNWLYVPSFDTSPTFTCANATYGCWTAQALVVHNGFATAGAFNTQATVHDFAIAIVGPGGKNGTTQLDSLGSNAIAYPAISTGGKVYAFGYPAAGRYKGRDLTYCAGNTFDDPSNADATWGIACNMTGGSSGGPWFGDFTEPTGVGTLTSLNSYGYSGVSNMYGPKFNSDTRDVVSTAGGATANTIVP